MPAFTANDARRRHDDGAAGREHERRGRRADRGDVRGRHADAGRQGRDGGPGPEPASAVVGRARRHEFVRDLRGRSRRAGRPNRMGVEGLSLGDDEPRVEFAHWLVADIPADVHELAEGAGGDGFVAHGKPPEPPALGAVTGQNGYRGLFEGNADLEGTYGGWDGPFPPWNDEHVHHYVTTVYALDVDSSASGPGSRSRSSGPRSTGTCSTGARSSRSTR